MEATKPLFATFLILVLLALACYYAWRQVQTLRAWPDPENLAPEDLRYVRRQAWRRLFGCGLMVLFAGLLGGWFVFGLDARASQLAELGEMARARAEPLQLSDEQMRALRVCVCYVIGALLVLLVMVGTAAADYWAIRCFGVRQRRQIEADRRAMIEHQVARLRSQRNGHPPG